MKSPCCNSEMKTYQSDCYPYESGYRCSCCGNEFSDLQISRGALDKDLSKHNKFDSNGMYTTKTLKGK